MSVFPLPAKSTALSITSAKTYALSRAFDSDIMFPIIKRVVTNLSNLKERTKAHHIMESASLIDTFFLSLGLDSGVELDIEK